MKYSDGFFAFSLLHSGAHFEWFLTVSLFSLLDPDEKSQKQNYPNARDVINFKHPVELVAMSMEFLCSFVVVMWAITFVWSATVLCWFIMWVMTPRYSMTCLQLRIQYGFLCPRSDSVNFVSPAELTTILKLVHVRPGGFRTLIVLREYAASCARVLLISCQ